MRKAPASLVAPSAVLLLLAAAWIDVVKTGLFWQGTAVARATGVFLVVVAPCFLLWQGWHQYRLRRLSRWHGLLAVLSWLYVVGVASPESIQRIVPVGSTRRHQ